MIRIGMTSVFALCAGMAAASETREAEAHVHGEGKLDIAIEGGMVQMAFAAPSADIVGFEHEADSAEDRAAIEAAVASLAKPLELFVLPEAAGCTLVSAEVQHGETGGHDHEAEHEHDDHGHDEHAEADHDDHDHEDHAEAEDDDHDHDEHAAGGHDDHGDEAHEDHAEHEGEGDRHAEFEAAYSLECSEPDAITEIEFAYFETYPNAQSLDVQLVTEAGASAEEVTREIPRLTISGTM